MQNCRYENNNGYKLNIDIFAWPNKNNSVILEPSSLEVVDSPGVPGLEPRAPLESSEVPLVPPTGLPLVELHPPPPPQYNNEPSDR